MAYPVDVRVDYGTGERSRGLALLGIIYAIKTIALLPHLIIVGVLSWAMSIVVWVGYWIILFTGRQPEGIDRFAAGVIRWSTRTYAWMASTTDKYPAFSFDDDPGDSQTTIEWDDEPRNRLLAASGIFGIKYVLAVPHFIVLSFLLFAAIVASWFGYWAILFTGRLPEGLHDYVVGTLQWSARVSAWITSLTDRYPPFALR
jgi:hypothetical protein